MKYVTPTTSGFGYTAGKLYQILLTYEGGQFVVKNDKGVNQIIRGDGKPSLRLERGGKFEVVDYPDTDGALEYAIKTGKSALPGEVKPIIENAVENQNTREALREHVKGVVKDSIVSAALPGGVLHKTVNESDHLRAVRQIAANATELANEVALCRYDASLYMRLENAEREAAQHKADCIKAEAIVDQLYDIFPQVRNPEQLVAAVRSSKIFADAFLELQKVK